MVEIVEVKTRKQRKAFVNFQVELYKDNKYFDYIILCDDDIAPCTPEERWADPEKYAVMKNGRKSAVRVFDTLIDAENCAGELGNSHYVETRPAVSRKCGKYCLCKDFCSFYRGNK